MSVVLIASELQAAKHVWREVLLCFSLFLGAWKAPGMGPSQQCHFTRCPKQEIFEHTLKPSWAAGHCSQIKAQCIHQRGPEDARLFSGIPMETFVLKTCSLSVSISSYSGEFFPAQAGARSNLLEPEEFPRLAG